MPGNLRIEVSMHSFFISHLEILKAGDLLEQAVIVGSHRKLVYYTIGVLDFLYNSLGRQTGRGVSYGRKELVAGLGPFC